jgi:hypothetical protein
MAFKQASDFPREFLIRRNDAYKMIHQQQRIE